MPAVSVRQLKLLTCCAMPAVDDTYSGFGAGVGWGWAGNGTHTGIRAGAHASYFSRRDKLLRRDGPVMDQKYPNSVCILDTGARV